MLCICSHPFFSHRCLSLSWKPTLQLAPSPYSGELRPVHSCRDTKEPLSIATPEEQVNKGQKKGWVRSHRMPCDPCWQESSWGRVLGPARVDGINPPERDERKWGLQILLLKSFAEKLSAKKPEFMIVIISMKNCFLVLGFFFFHTGFWGVFFVCLFWNFWPHL